MNSKAFYYAPLGTIKIGVDDHGLASLYFVDQGVPSSTTSNQTILNTITWLDTYFAGKTPEKAPSFHLYGTEF